MGVSAKTVKKRTLLGKHPSPYPYTILYAQPPLAPIIKQLDPLNVIHFFRIEALLRSETVITGYKNGQLELRKLLWPEHQVVFDVLNGEHHVLLQIAVPELAKEDQLEHSGIKNLSSLPLGEIRGTRLMVRNADERLPDSDYFIPGLLTQIEVNNPRYLYLRIDTRYPPTVIKEALDLLLSPHHKQFAKAREKLTGEQLKLVTEESRRGRSWTAPFEVETWLQYLRCYDLKKVGGRLDGEIGELVYEKRNDQSRKRVVNAVKRVKELIHQAENYLPPFDVFGSTNV